MYNLINTKSKGVTTTLITMPPIMPATNEFKIGDSANILNCPSHNFVYVKADNCDAEAANALGTAAVKPLYRPVT